MTLLEKIKFYYDNGLWTIQRVWDVVGKVNGLTEEEYELITGFSYPNLESVDM